MGDFRIRRAQLEDADGILTCLGTAFERYRENYTADAYADTVLNPMAIQFRLQVMNVFVAVWQAQVVGTVACGVDGREGHLRGMAVLPDWLGARVASELLLAAENDLRRRHCTYVTLDTTGPLKRAIRFYEKHGFSATGKVSDFFGMPLYEYSKYLQGL